MSRTTEIVPRRGLSFGLDEQLPRFWFGGDPFRTRYFDATSLAFPEGEKFFIAAVNNFRAHIEDPELLAQVRAFSAQEAQHSLVHARYNERLRGQGVDVDMLEGALGRGLSFLLRHMPHELCLAQTAAAEHFTACLAKHLLTRPELTAEADPRVRSLFMWHAVEEIEHKSVAFDVMRAHAQVPYLVRVWYLLQVLVFFQLRTFVAINHMLGVDGLTPRERRSSWRGGLRWLFARDGFYRPMARDLAAYFRPDFHPWQESAPSGLQRWKDQFTHSGDPIRASDALQQQGA